MDWRQQTESHRLELVINWDQGPCRGKVWSTRNATFQPPVISFWVFQSETFKFSRAKHTFCGFFISPLFQSFYVTELELQTLSLFTVPCRSIWLTHQDFCPGVDLNRYDHYSLKFKITYCFQFFISARLSLFHWRVIRRAISWEDLFSFMPSRRRGLPWFHEGLAFLS